MKRIDELTSVLPLRRYCNSEHFEYLINVFAFDVYVRRDEPSDVPFATLRDGYLVFIFFLFFSVLFSSCFEW